MSPCKQIKGDRAISFRLGPRIVDLQIPCHRVKEMEETAYRFETRIKKRPRHVFISKLLIEPVIPSFGPLIKCPVSTTAAMTDLGRQVCKGCVATGSGNTDRVFYYFWTSVNWSSSRIH